MRVLLKHDDEEIMKDFDIVIKQNNGNTLVVNTEMIEEDVVRTLCGLETKEQD